MLLVSDLWIIGFGIGQAVWSGVLTVTLWLLTQKFAGISAIETRLNRKSEELIDTKFEAAAKSATQSVQALSEAIAQLRQQISQAEVDLNDLDKRDQRIELNVAATVGSLKDYIRETVASKNDVERQQKKLEVVAEQVTRLDERVAAIKGK
jgi:chromosome segregation ATPase